MLEVLKMLETLKHILDFLRKTRFQIEKPKTN
jgi:hypothetical protein